MDKQQKKRVKKYISWICLAVLILGLAVMPLLATNNEEAEGPHASILSGTVETGSISTGLNGGGTLAAQEAEEILIPSGVKITEFLVKNGEIVAEGDALAAVDRVTVMTAIASVQETMDYLMEEMADATEESASSKVTAQAGGLVKVIYAREGENVQDVMLRDGALAVLSLDGLMAVDIERNTDLTTGDPVTVLLEDETELAGRVDSNMDGVLTVTVEDDGYDVGDPVIILTEDGSRIGSGTLYVHNAWNAVAYTGTVSKINTAVNKNVSAGTKLMTLTDTEFNAELESLLSQYRDYEELMLDLFRMYQNTAITAPCDGMVSGIDEDSIHLLSAGGTSYSLTQLANAPNGNDEAAYTNFVGMVTGMDQGSWDLAMNPQALPITDYTDLSAVPADPAEMTKPLAYIPIAPIYELVDGSWVQISASGISTGDILLFACDDSGSFVWLVRIHSAAGGGETEPSESTVPPAVPGETTVPSESTGTTDPTQPTETPSEPETESPTTPTVPSSPDTPSVDNPFGNLIPGGTGIGNIGGMSGMMGSYFGGNTVQQEEPFELFDLEGSLLMSVVPQETMTLSISVDEQDISKVEPGMTANISIPALRNESFTAAVTKIGGTGSNNGGSSKFTVEISIPIQENMLNGMSATATIPLTTTENVPVIPVEALVDDGSRTYVYTRYDEKNGILTDPVEVTLGVSDGSSVEILSGLQAGDTYWYEYYDTLEIDTSVESGFPFP